jgi:hypothetical protein
VWSAVGEEAVRVVLEANGSGVALFPDPDGYQVEITTYEPAPV